MWFSDSRPSFLKDVCGLYKNLLQDLTSKEGLSIPAFATTKSGPSHVPIFTSTVDVEGDVFHGVEAKTKKQAEINAAKVAYFSLKKCQLSRMHALLSQNDDAQESLECIYSSSHSTIADDWQHKLNLEELGNMGYSSPGSLSIPSQDGSSSPTTVLECFDGAVTEQNTDMPAAPCTLLCNRVRVYPRKPVLKFAKGITLLPIIDDKWVAVSLDYPN